MPFDPDAVMWSTPESERAGKPLLVLLHGYGSHEGDLFGLSPYLPLGVVVASVRAPDPHPMGIGWQWYPIPVEAGPGVEAGNAATDEVATWLRGIRGGAPSLGLLGFSQGASIALQLLRRHPDAADYAVLLSGLMSPEPDPGDDALSLRRPPVFWGHGTADEIIDDFRVAQLDAWLPTHTTLTRRFYEGLGHSIADSELRDVVAFIEERIAKR